MTRTIYAYSRELNRKRVEVKKRVEETLKKNGYEIVYEKRIKNILFSALEKNVIGMYDPKQRVILLDDDLLNFDLSTIINITLHEAAHAICIYLYKDYTHSDKFKSICKTLSCTDDYDKAKIKINEREKLVDKIKKLTALGNSPFEAEAQAALAKVSSLTVKYDLESSYKDEDIIYEIELVRVNRSSVKLRLFCDILSLYLPAFIVYKHQNDGTLSIMGHGSYSELEVLDYLYDTLSRSIENALKDARRKDPVLYKGIKGTNSFYYGVYKALSVKLDKDKSAEDAKALTILSDKNSKLADELIYNNKLTKSRVGGFLTREGAINGGKEFGSSMNISQGIKNDDEILFLS